MSVVFKAAAGCSGALPKSSRAARGRPSLELQPATQSLSSPISSPAASGPRYQQEHRRTADWQCRGRVSAQRGWKHRCRAVSKTAEGSQQQQEGCLQPGRLISYKKDDKHILALIEAADGKKNWWIVDQRGRRFSLPARTVSLVLPGSNYSQADVQRFIDAVTAADMSILELAWSVAAEDFRSYSLPEMAHLLFDDQTAVSQYVTFCMMLHDDIFFKPAYKAGVWSFEPRDADAVEVAKAAAEAEAAAAAARATFLQDWAAARAAAAKERPSDIAAVQQAWRAGPHGERVTALMEFALSTPGKCPEASDVLARDTLALLRKRPEPDVAAALLSEVGLLRRHEPLPLLRAGRSVTDCDPTVEAAAQALLSSPPPDPDASTRLDLTHLNVFTVDDASTTEVDDGLSVTADEQGRTLLWVHVADPTRWLTPGDLLDTAARSRSRTLYFPWGSVAMFPRSLAEGPFSLSSSSGSMPQEQQQDCCAFSVCASLNEDGSLAKLVKLGPSNIRVTHRLTYDEADADLGMGPGLCRYEELQLIYQAARLRRAWRVSRGCIDIDLPEAKLEVAQGQLDAAAPAVTCTKLSQWESAARLMVAEMMILAGEAVGSLGAAKDLPLPYRGQDAPQLPSQEVLEALPEGPCKGYALRRCMTRSMIETSPVRHASLALDAYVQFTSPIRRYSDILAHFNLKAHLRGEALPFSAAAIQSITAAAGESARELGRAEGEVTKYWAAEYLRQHRGETWAAMVLGWLRPEMQLAAVTFEELGLETVVKVDFPVAPGDRLLLRLAEVDVSSGFYRMYVHDRLPDPGVADSEDAIDDELARQMMLSVSEPGDDSDGVPDAMPLDLTEPGSEGDSEDMRSVVGGLGSQDVAGRDQQGWEGTTKVEPLAWRAAVAGEPSSPGSSSCTSSTISSSAADELLFGSFTSSEVSSEVLLELPGTPHGQQRSPAAHQHGVTLLI